MTSKEWSIQEIAWLLAIGFGTVWAATSISSMVFGEGSAVQAASCSSPPSPSSWHRCRLSASCAQF